jgi:hypothetical protein
LPFKLPPWRDTKHNRDGGRHDGVIFLAVGLNSSALPGNACAELPGGNTQPARFLKPNFLLFTTTHYFLQVQSEKKQGSPPNCGLRSTPSKLAGKKHRGNVCSS